MDELQARPGRVQIREGWCEAGRGGTKLGGQVYVGQYWTPVLMDGDEDPTFHKSRGLEPEHLKTSGQEQAKRDAAAIAEIRKWSGDSLTFDAACYLANRLEEMTRAN